MLCLQPLKGCCLINNSKHLYQMKREYALSYNGINVDRNKVMFGDCINLIDETKKIQKILYKYRNTNRIDDMTRLAILNSIESGMSYTEVAQEYDIARATISKILREFNYKSFVISNSVICPLACPLELIIRLA